MSPVIEVQRRLMELGRVRLGEKGTKGEPRKLNSFRFTSASRTLLEAVAKLYGGNVTEWSGAPDEGYFQVTTDATELPIMFPPVFNDRDGEPTLPFSQWYEAWSGGGCTRRCDGETEAISGKGCLCDPEARECQITTRLSFILPDVPGLGVWRLDSKGWNAATELPGTVSLLMLAAAQSKFIPATLRLEQRTKKVPGEGTRRFVVPVIDLPTVRMGDLLAGGDTGGAPLAVNAPVVSPRLPRPELPSAGADLPPDPSFTNDKAETPGWGQPPEPERFDDDLELTDLTMRLCEALKSLGQEEHVGLIVKHAQAHSADEHKVWLRDQVARAEAKLVASAAEALKVPVEVIEAEGEVAELSGEEGTPDASQQSPSSFPENPEQPSFFEQQAEKTQTKRRTKA